MKKKPNHTLISSLFITVLCVAALALVATLPGGGWWFGAQVQNVSNSTASVTYTLYDFASNTYSRSDNINPGASMNYALNNFSLPNNFQGSSKANSNQDIRAIVNLTTRGVVINGTTYGDYNSPSPAAGQYQGMEAGDTTLRFPLVKIDNYNKSTTIIVQNAGTGSASATASFTFGSTTYNYYAPTIGPGKMAIIEPIYARNGDSHPPTNSVGSLKVTSSQPLTGVALEHFTGELHATVLQATRGFTNSDANSTLYAPINKNNYYNHRFTGLQVQNADSHPVDIYVTYYLTCQSGTRTDQFYALQPNASHTFDSSVLPDNCFAPATISATGNIVGIVNESFTTDYLNNNPNQAQEATSYAAIPHDPFISRHILSVPLFKEDSYSKTTGVSVQNIGSAPAYVVATFKNSSRTFVTNYMIINSNQAIVLQDMRLLQGNPNPPSWWRGWNTNLGDVMDPTILGCVSGENGCGANGVFSLFLNSINNYPIVAIANETTYPIDAPRIHQDKSNYEAFSLLSQP
jgi:hypothetical protein